VPLAVNCWVVPSGMVELAGIIDMDNKAAEVTVRVVVSELPPEILVDMLELAVMVVVPTATAVARPLLLIVATEVFDELQVTCVVISPFVWSL